MDIKLKEVIPKVPYLGFGLGLRPDYYQEILTEKPAVDWFEVLSENYLVPGGKPLYYLDAIRQDYPVVMHGVSLSIGSSDALDMEYLSQLKGLANRIEPVWISDHLCWTGVRGLNIHDLLPLPYTTYAIEHIVSRIHQIQDLLKCPFLIENVSSYLTYKQSEMSEWDFMIEIVRRSGCYILLDVNNVYVSSINHSFDPLEYITALPADRVAQIHLAGHADHGLYVIDTHDAPVTQPVWELYRETIRHLGRISTMIERDDHMPPLSVLLDEMNEARRISDHVLREEVPA